MFRRAVVGLFGVVAGTGCFFDSDDAEVHPPEGEFYQYVAGGLHIPATITEARMFGLDLNGDKAIDNQLGMIFGALESQGFGVRSTVLESLLRGNAILLAELQTVDFDETVATGLRTDMGTNPNPAACIDPEILDTCGRHFTRRATFDVVPATASHVGVAPIKGGTFIAPVSTLPIAIGLDPLMPLRVDLRGARIQLTNITPLGATAILAGGIPEDELDTVVIPEVARNLERILQEDCGVPNEPARCGCPSGSRGGTLQSYFDPNDDCTISIEEIRTNSLVQALFSPDVRIDGIEMLSFGLGVDFIPAEFTR